MAKRSAVKQLTQDNFEDSEDEDAGNGPKIASEEELKKRVIKTGKRRLAGSSGEGAGNIFAGFQGFGGSAAQPKNGSDSKPSFNFASSTPAPKSAVSTTSSNEPVDAEAVFCGKIKSLNTQFLKWAQDQVATLNGVIDLTPCMKDYQKHMDDLKVKLEKDKAAKTQTFESGTSVAEFKFGAAESKAAEPVSTSSSSFGGFSLPSTTSAKPATTSSGFGIIPTGSSLEPKASSGFSFGSIAAASTAVPKFSFGVPTTDAKTSKAEAPIVSATVNPLTSGTSTFSFGAPKQADTASTFSFGMKPQAPGIAPGFFGGASAQAAEKQNEEEGGEEDEEQEKYEKKDIKESDAFFEVRTKLFYLSGKEFKSRGIGNVFLKKVGEKVQMIVRADNNLGTVLLNIFVKNVAPKIEQGKNSVSMWCVPNPPLDAKSADQTKPVKFVFKVKDESSAQQLFEHLEKQN